MLGTTIHTTQRTYFKAAIGRDDFSVRAVLSVPVPDLAGDIVRSEGLDFARHQADPWVDLEHGFDPVAQRLPVGWTRKSLKQPGAAYALEWAELPVPGVGKAKLPISTTYFDRDDPLQRQTYHLIRTGALPGVSLEFLPVTGFAKSLGPSPLERRDAFDFGRAEVLRYTHCVEPVCPTAQVVLKSLPPELESLAKTLRDGRIEGEELHPVIVKSLARYRPTVALVSVGKAMPDAANDTATIYDPQPGDPNEAPAKPTAAAHYNFAQAITSAIEQAKQDLKSSEHVKGRKFLLAKLDKIEAEVDAIKAMGDKLDAETGDTEASEPTDDEANAADTTTDSDGTFKAVRRVYKPVLKAVQGAKGYSLDEVLRGIEKAKEANRTETRAEALARLQKEDPAEYARLSAKAQKLARLNNT